MIDYWIFAECVESLLRSSFALGKWHKYAFEDRVFSLMKFNIFLFKTASAQVVMVNNIIDYVDCHCFLRQASILETYVSRSFSLLPRIVVIVMRVVL